VKRAALIVPLLWSIAAEAQAPPDAVIILKKVGEIYTNAKSYHFVGKNETIRDGKAVPEEDMRIEIAIRRSDRLLMSTQGKVVAIVNGNRMYLANPETGEGRVVKRRPMNVDMGQDEDVLKSTDLGFTIRYRAFASFPGIAHFVREEAIVADGSTVRAT
jgi:hypothetical protein